MSQFVSLHVEGSEGSKAMMRAGSNNALHRVQLLSVPGSTESLALQLLAWTSVQKNWQRINAISPQPMTLE